ncbi:MAG: hypothetical protein KKA42_11605, partial [candidate division Zixibacteria bacterium]|nr:hypothetical protein [candidate division Zixibacteria bacterium]
MVVLIAVLLMLPWAGFAAVPKLINYQGYLADGAGQPVPDGSYQIYFRIYPYPTGGSALWESGSQTVSVSGGGFSYLLGSQVTLPDHLFDNSITRYLGITVGTDAEIVPRTRLVTVPYAYQALHADTSDYAVTVADHSVTNAKLADGAVTDASVSAAADIDPAKIDGTAMVLSGSWQTVSGFVEYTGPNVYMHDSSFQSSGYGIKIGSRVAHGSDEALLEVDRNYNNTTTRYGVRARLDNSSTGYLYGIRSEVEHTTAGSGGTAYGVYGHAMSDGSQRTGTYGLGQSRNASITTGTSVGVSGVAYDGAYAYGIMGYAGSATTNYAGYF